ncbi:MAG: TRAP transporter small permease subunit [Deltaproteobacteria bacterium]|nr:TRAP transporter small permease subunit [Deltaproteobacteria bacterium]
MELLQRIDKLIRRIESGLLILFLSLMVSLTFLRILLRASHVYGRLQWADFLMGYLDWTEPMVRLLVLWVAFLGASLLTGESKHIKIDLMSELLPSRCLAYREMILSAACVLVAALMVQASLGYVRMEWSFGGRLFLGMPTWIGQVVMPVGFLLIMFRFLLRGLGQALVLLGERRP